jgi:tRNA(Ile2) C34 agmatinyltransferase TiaS
VTLFLFFGQVPSKRIRTTRVSEMGRGRPNAGGLRVANLSRIENNAKTERRERAVKCPRCGTVMDEVARIAPSLGDPGLIGYECPNCVYVTSEMLQPSFKH